MTQRVESSVTYLGLTGRMASGKGEFVKTAEELGYRYISLSDIVRRRAAENGEIPSRERMQDIGNGLRKEGGAGVLGRLVREEIEKSSVRRWVIDGIRNPAEVEELKKIDNFFLIAVETDERLIIERLRKRSRFTDIANDEELKKRLDREWGINEPADGQQVGKCVKSADIHLLNNGSLGEFRKRVISLIGELEGKNE